MLSPHICKIGLLTKWKVSFDLPLLLTDGSDWAHLLTQASPIRGVCAHQKLLDFVSTFLRNRLFPAGSQTLSFLLPGPVVLDTLAELEKAKNKKEISVVIFADLKKAFDTVNFNILFSKLRHYGIEDKFFKSYLAERTQFTQIENTNSSDLTIDCGVPQGSVLGPLLFLIYINDLPLASPTFKTLLFADDTTLVISGKNPSELIETCNRELLKVSSWFRANGLTLHEGKTMFMVFNTIHTKDVNDKILLNGVKLTRVGNNEKMKSIKFVGFHIDEKLTWKEHATHVLSKIKKNSFLIRGLREKNGHKGSWKISQPLTSRGLLLQNPYYLLYDFKRSALKYACYNYILHRMWHQ